MAIRRERLLIAEDELPNLRLFEQFFGPFGEGYEVGIAEDGEAALQMVDNFHPDIILLDVQMPRRDGLDVCARLKSSPATSPIPIILATALKTPDDIVNGLKAGADDYICKPVNLRELAARLERLLHRKRTFDALRADNVAISSALGDRTKAIRDLFTVSMCIGRATSLDEVLAAVSDALAQLLDCRRVAVLLPHRRRGTLRIPPRGGSVGVPQDMVVDCELKLDQAAARAMQAGGPWIVSAADRSSPLAAYRAALPFAEKTLLAMPMSIGGELVGILNALDHPRAEVSEEDRHVVAYLAQLAAASIQSWARHEELRRTQEATTFALARLAESRDRLDPEETAEMRRHTHIGADNLAAAEEMLGDNSFLAMAQSICLHHHEHWDGTGYPNGLAADNIPLPARIVAVADVYDALTSERTYKRAYPHETACAMVRADSGRKFDPRLVAAFDAIADEFNRVRMRFRDVAHASSDAPPAAADVSVVPVGAGF